jgi:hypothetical protein
MPTPLQVNSTRSALADSVMWFHPEPAHPDRAPLADGPIEVWFWDEASAQAAEREVGARSRGLPDEFHAVSWSKTFAKFFGNARANELVSLDQNSRALEAGNGGGIEQKAFVTFDIAQDERVLVGDSPEFTTSRFEKGLQAGRLTIASDFDPVANTIEHRHFPERCSTRFRPLEGNNAGLRIPQSQANGVVSLRSAQINNEPWPVGALFFDDRNQLALIGAQQFRQIRAPNRTVNVAHPGKRPEPHSVIAALAHEVREVANRAAPFRQDAPCETC